ncbi:MAG TPA: molybdate ABC transporter permease subunit [Thermoanaerobaculia bacterium]|jgi:molybdate transport system permease protein|nr:molybdate ABC transporter permease subunit [Thermoanaerobaculia bacterium]
MNADEWQILGFTLRTAGLALLLILPPGIALGWLLARRSWPGKTLIETLAALPLVLPPVATGFLLLRLFGRRGPLGAPLHERLGLDVIFTWRGVVVAMAVMSLPLLVRASRVAFEGVETRLEDVARTLGAGELRVLATITLPLAARGLLGGALLAFARALGEFGATIIVAGNIPGRTTTLALAIFQRIQLGEDGAALRLMTAAVVVAFAAVWVGEVLLRRGDAR